MPDNSVQWAFAAYFALGSFGGLLYFINYIVDKMAAKDKYNPWEEMARPTVEPSRNEPPISARKK